MTRFASFPWRSRRALLLASALFLGLEGRALAAAPDAHELQIDLSSHRAVRVERGPEVTGERFQTAANESLEILFADGSSLLLSGDSDLTVTSFAFDPSTGAGVLNVALARGGARIILGRADHDAPFTLTAGAATVALDGGAATVAIEPQGVRAALLFGGRLHVRAAGGEAVIERPGFQSVVAAGAAPRAPQRQSEGEAFADAQRANPYAGARVELADAGSDAATDDNRDLGEPPGPPPFQRIAAAAIGGAGAIGLGDSAIAYADNAQQGLSGDAQFTVLINSVQSQVAAVSGGILFTSDSAPSPGLSSLQLHTTNRLLHSAEAYQGAGLSVQRDDGAAYVSYALPQPLQINDPVNLPGVVRGADGYDSDAVQMALEDILPGNDQDLSTPLVCATSGCAEFERLIDLLLRHDTDLKIVLGPVAGRSPVHVNTIGSLVGTNQALSIPNSVLDAAQQRLVQQNVAAIGLRVSPTLFAEDPTGVQIGGSTGPRSNLEPFDTEVTLLQAGFSGGARAADNFLMVEAPWPDPASADHFIFAVGGVDISARVAADTIDSFALYGDLNGYGAGDALTGTGPDLRAFAPGDPSAYAAFAATPLYIANAAASGAAQNAVFQADFGLSADGRDSTISVTLGNVTYGAYAFGAPNVTFNARTVGSTQSGAGASSVIVSPLTDTAFGGGNVWNGNETRAGYAGYFVLENNSISWASGVTALSGGTVSPLGGADSSYGVLRLAVGDASVADANTQRTSYQGFLAGLVEQQSGSAVQVGFLDSGGAAHDPGNFTLTTDAALNRVAAGMSLRGADGGLVPLTLGGLAAGDAPSAFIQASDAAHPGLYGAATSGGDAALVSGGAVATGALSAIGQYRYVQWGFFFGDIGAGAHVHLASWAAGEVLPIANYTLRGSASYGGHALGEVAANGDIRTVVGAFTQSWNFDARQGSMTLDFDNAHYTADTLSFDNPSVDLRYSGALSGPADRAGEVDGVLVGATAGGLPGGSVGQFAIENTPGDYVASGTFGGDISDAH